MLNTATISSSLKTDQDCASTDIDYSEPHYARFQSCPEIKPINAQYLSSSATTAAAPRSTSVNLPNNRQHHFTFQPPRSQYSAYLAPQSHPFYNAPRSRSTVVSPTLSSVLPHPSQVRQPPQPQPQSATPKTRPNKQTRQPPSTHGVFNSTSGIASLTTRWSQIRGHDVQQQQAGHHPENNDSGNETHRLVAVPRTPSVNMAFYEVLWKDVQQAYYNAVTCVSQSFTSLTQVVCGCCSTENQDFHEF